jgi:hypothetical protein
MFGQSPLTLLISSINQYLVPVTPARKVVLALVTSVRRSVARQPSTAA